MTDQNNDQAAKIAAIKARLAKGSSGDGDKQPEAKPDAPAAASGGGADHVVVPSGDKDALVAAIKARRSGGPRAVIEGNDPGTPASAPAAAAADAGGDGGEAGGGGDDMQARIAALKAKMEAGKGAESAPTTTTSSAAPKAKAKSGTPKGGGKQLFPVKPINKTSFGDERLYFGATMTRWFSFAGILLFIGGILMWVRDWDRGWKAWQQLKMDRDVMFLEEEIEAERAALADTNIDELRAELDDVTASLEAGSQETDRLLEEVRNLEGEEYKAKKAYQSNKSIYDAAKYSFEHERIAHGDDPELLAESNEEILAIKERTAELKANWDLKSDDLAEAKRALADHRARQTELTKEIDALEGDLELLESRKAAIGPSLFNDYIRNAPLVDMLAPTLEIEQYVLADLHDDYNFMEVDRIDRCTTCHIAIDNPAYSNHDASAVDDMIGPYVPADERPDEIPEELRELDERGEVVLNAHPRLDLFVSDKSPHPAKDFGCTTCHWGRGQAVEFERTFHMPAAEYDAAGNLIESKQAKQERWVRDFGYDPSRHYWDWPMIPKDMAYSACFQCHDSTDRIPGVPEYNEPRELVEDLGCYACHKIQGFEHLRKPGPDLTNLAHKTNEEWIQKWLMSPKSFRPSTRMPHFWNLSNSGGQPDVMAYDDQPELRIDTDVEWDNVSDKYVDDWRVRNQVEARAVAAYILSKSEESDSDYENEPLPADVDGDPEAGRELVYNRGCLGCHSIEAEGWMENDHGPDLSAVGSKVDADWMYSWIMDPHRYYETTVMPSLRLTPEEGAHITAYMLTLTDPEWEEIEPPQQDVETLRSIAADFRSSTTSVTRAEVFADETSPEELELYVGEKIFTRFGCAGCHLVPGHYDDMGIGVELTQEALKELSKFDFSFESWHGSDPPEGHSDIEHTVWGWIDAKLEDPRRFDRVPVIEESESGPYVARYEQKVKRPLDKLRMPYYFLTDEERHQVVTFVMGLREVGVAPSMKHNLTPEEKLTEEGSRLITAYNCTGCHKMGQLPLPATLDEELINQGYEEGVWMAHAFEYGGETLFGEGEWLTDEFYNPWEEYDDFTVDFLDAEGVLGRREVLVYGTREGAIGRYYDEAAFRPPMLRRQGEKTRPGWLYDFLLEPYIVRPHLEVRMPSFGFTPQESRALVHWFASNDDGAWPFYLDEEHGEFDPKLYAAGEKRFNDYGCNQCHPAGDQLPSNPDKANWGPDLSLAQTRLQSEWVGHWLKEPQEFQPGTKMPAFFGEVYDGEFSPAFEDWEQQIDELQHYLMHMSQTMGSGEPSDG